MSRVLKIRSRQPVVQSGALKRARSAQRRALSTVDYKYIMAQLGRLSSATHNPGNPLLTRYPTEGPSLSGLVLRPPQGTNLIKYISNLLSSENPPRNKRFILRLTDWEDTTAVTDEVLSMLHIAAQNADIIIAIELIRNEEVDTIELEPTSFVRRQMMQGALEAITIYDGYVEGPSPSTVLKAKIFEGMTWSDVRRSLKSSNSMASAILEACDREKFDDIRDHAPSDVIKAALILDLRHSRRSMLSSATRARHHRALIILLDQGQDIINVLEVAKHLYNEWEMLKMILRKNLPLSVYAWLVDNFQLSVGHEAVELSRIFFSNRTEWDEVIAALHKHSNDIDLRVELARGILLVADDSMPTFILYLAQMRLFEVRGVFTDDQYVESFTKVLNLLFPRKAWSEIDTLVDSYMRIFKDQREITEVLKDLYNNALDTAIEAGDWESVEAILKNAKSEGISIDRGKVTERADKTTPMSVILAAAQDSHDVAFYERALRLAIQRRDWDAARKLHELAFMKFAGFATKVLRGAEKPGTLPVKDFSAQGAIGASNLGIILATGIEQYPPQLDTAVMAKEWDDARAIFTIAADFYDIESRLNFITIFYINEITPSLPADILKWLAINAENSGAATTFFRHLLERREYEAINEILADNGVRSNRAKLRRFFNEIIRNFDLLNLVDKVKVLEQLEEHSAAQYYPPLLREQLAEDLISIWSSAGQAVHFEHLMREYKQTHKWNPFKIPVSFIDDRLTDIIPGLRAELGSEIPQIGDNSIVDKDDPQGRLSIEDGKKGALTVVDEEAVEIPQETPQTEQAPSRGMFSRAVRAILGFFIGSKGLRLLWN